MIPDELKRALGNLRAVRAQRPDGPSTTLTYAQWRDHMADALDALAETLLFSADRDRAAAEATAARREAAAIRARLADSP
ncbi:hypothetical protein ACVDFE_10725 [Lentzea chajnantorensis]